MNTDRIREGFMPWSGLALGTAGYFLAHQLGGDSTFQDCRVGSPMFVIIAVIAALIIIAVGALGSWRVYADESGAPARRLVSIVSLLACALYTMGVLLPLIASLVIPQCWA